MLKTLVLSQVKPENFMRDWNYKPNGTAFIEFLCKNAWLCEKNIRVKPLIGNTPSNTRTYGNYRINGFDDNKWSWMLIWITKVKKIFPMNINLPPPIESTPLISIHGWILRESCCQLCWIILFKLTTLFTGWIHVDPSCLLCHSNRS